MVPEDSFDQVGKLLVLENARAMILSELPETRYQRKSVRRRLLAALGALHRYVLDHAVQIARTARTETHRGVFFEELLKILITDTHGGRDVKVQFVFVQM